MKLIIGLGNPGDQYHLTRHNTGFLVVEDVAQQERAAFKTAPKFFADVAEFSHDGEKVLLVKPSTFYNEIGRSYAALKQFYKIDNDDILIIHDELALPFGTIRARVGGNDAGNNGIKSINAHGGDATPRLRIGVGNELRARMGDTDFVLGRFSKDEHQTLDDKIIPKCREIVDLFITDDHQITSHTLVDKSVSQG